MSFFGPRFLAYQYHYRLCRAWLMVGKAKCSRSLNSAWWQDKNCTSINETNTKYFLSLTGHCSLNKLLLTLKLMNIPYCIKCGETETAEHFLCHCPTMINTRSAYLGTYQLHNSSIWRIHHRLMILYFWLAATVTSTRPPRIPNLQPFQGFAIVRAHIGLTDAHVPDFARRQSAYPILSRTPCPESPLAPNHLWRYHI